MFEGFRREVHPVEKSLEKDHARAVEIAGMGKYAHILELLREDNLLPQEVARVEREYALDKIPFLNEKDKEMFAVLDLYDPGTARHCLQTYEIAREKIEKEIAPGVSFAHLLEKNESITADQFYRACLFHDIGKVEVPRAVIRHHMNEGHMLECMHHLYHEGKISASLGLSQDASDVEIDVAMKQHALRGIDVVPAHEVLSPEDLAEVQRFGYTGDETLMAIIRPHEAGSGTILTEAGYGVEAKIAALHHNYNNEKPEHAFAVSMLHMSVDLSEMLHIADLVEALSSSTRSYKAAFSMPRVMRIIVEHVESGKIAPTAARLWLADALHDYESVSHEAVQKEDAAHLASVHEFLEHEEEVVLA